MAVSVRSHQNLIAGEWVDAASGEAFESRDPPAKGTFPPPDGVRRR
jgi:hypothetical protein